MCTWSAVPRRVAQRSPWPAGRTNSARNRTGRARASRRARRRRLAARPGRQASRPRRRPGRRPRTRPSSRPDRRPTCSCTGRTTDRWPGTRTAPAPGRSRPRPRAARWPRRTGTTGCCGKSRRGTARPAARLAAAALSS